MCLRFRGSVAASAEVAIDAVGLAVLPEAAGLAVYPKRSALP
jgi:hypothetical protein